MTTIKVHFNTRVENAVARVKELVAEDVVVVHTKASDDLVLSAWVALPVGAYLVSKQGEFMKSSDVAANSVVQAKLVGVAEDHILHNKDEMNDYFLGTATPTVGTTTGVPAFTPDKAITGKTPVAKQTIKEKVECNMENVKGKVDAGVEKVKDLATEVKGLGFVGSLKVAGTYLLDAGKSVWHYIKKERSTLATATGVTVVAGAVTSSAGTALCVGSTIALIMLVIQAIMKKVTTKQFFSRFGLSVAVGFLLPFVLYGLAYVGIFATTFGFILPYAIIVA